MDFSIEICDSQGRLGIAPIFNISILIFSIKISKNSTLGELFIIKHLK